MSRYHIIKVDDEAYYDILRQGIPHEDLDRELRECLKEPDEYHRASCFISVLRLYD